jgi:putative membrane protein
MTYYMGNHLFLTKMALLLAILVLEIKPMMTLLGWRRKLARGMPVEEAVLPQQARSVAVISHIEATIVVIMVVLAAGMARGVGMG